MPPATSQKNELSGCGKMSATDNFKGGRFAWSHGFRGFSPWPAGSTVMRMRQKHQESRLGRWSDSTGRAPAEHVLRP
jgi:hypothetical protein